ncbi:hypothetical protein C2S53_001042 [Perilla frutescens var. hirtella]|uniref:Uncharacterized protein n=1 Tax=Perilla frutescens var. hirtella TaxID=608512 RepID=A0AAD4PEQ0_PERFH|nr:hypothetical protein C2S53_001042 [Perilla frutescens var. hirtella]
MITQSAVWMRHNIISVMRLFYQCEFEPPNEFFDALVPLLDSEIEQGYMCKIVMVNPKAFADNVVNGYERLRDRQDESVVEEVLTLNTDMHGDSNDTKSNPDESNSINSEGSSKSNDSLAVMPSNLGLVNENDNAINCDNAISITVILPFQDGLKNRRVNQLKSCSVVRALVDELERKDRVGRDDIKATSISAGKHEIIKTMIDDDIDKVGPDGILFIVLSSGAAIKKRTASQDFST